MQLVLGIAAGAAMASNYDVGSGQQYATVGAAVAQAVQDPGDGHVIRIFDPGPFVESVSVTEAMEIRGEGVVPLLQASHADRGFFTVDAAGSVVTISSVELDGRGEHRVMLVLAGDVTLSDAQVHDAAHPSDPGGAILVQAGADDSLTVTGSTFTNCSTLQVEDGGAIAMSGGDLYVSGSTFEGGRVGDDGAHVAVIVGSGSDIVLEDSVLRNGVAEDGGGSVYLRDGDAIIRRCVFEGNSALDEGGGAIQAEAFGSILVEDVTFIGNHGFGSGGAVYQVDGQATYTRSVFCENHSDASGGAFFLDADTATIENSVFLWNTADQDGGAVKVDGVLAFSHNSLASNSAGEGFRGHALVSESSPGAAITDSFFGHHADGTQAVFSIARSAVSVEAGSWWLNDGGAWNAGVVDYGAHTMADSLIPAPPPGGCDPLLLVPPLGGPLDGAATDGTQIGAFGGPNTWPDGDADGLISLVDCDDGDPAAFPGATEVPADGVDQDCDLGDLCYADTDGDGFGDPATLVTSADLSCVDAGEAANGDELCEGHDDALDADADGIPDGCDVPGDEDPGLDPVDRNPGQPHTEVDDPVRTRPGSCGCSTGSPSGLSVLFGFVLLLVRRGR